MLLYKMIEFMKLSRIVKSLFVLCGEKRIEMTLELQGDSNKIVYNESGRELSITIPDTEDEKIIKELTELYNKIKSVP